MSFLQAVEEVRKAVTESVSFFLRYLRDLFHITFSPTTFSQRLRSTKKSVRPVSGIPFTIATAFLLQFALTLAESISELASPAGQVGWLVILQSNLAKEIPWGVMFQNALVIAISISVFALVFSHGAALGEKPQRGTSWMRLFPYLCWRAWVVVTASSTAALILGLVALWIADAAGLHILGRATPGVLALSVFFWVIAVCVPILATWWLAQFAERLDAGTWRTTLWRRCLLSVGAIAALSVPVGWTFTRLAPAASKVVVKVTNFSAQSRTISVDGVCTGFSPAPLYLGNQCELVWWDTLVPLRTSGWIFPSTEIPTGKLILRPATQVKISDEKTQFNLSGELAESSLGIAPRGVFNFSSPASKADLEAARKTLEKISRNEHPGRIELAFQTETGGGKKSIQTVKIPPQHPK